MTLFVLICLFGIEFNLSKEKKVRLTNWNKVWRVLIMICFICEGDDQETVKKKLKQWAQVVALSVLPSPSIG